MARRRGALSDEDRRLWSQVAATAVPMARHLPPDAPAGGQPAGAPSPPAHTAAAVPTVQAPSLPPAARVAAFRVGEGVAGLRGSTTVALAPTPAQRLADHPVRMDHKTHRRMSQGKLIPEARIDLHGMTLSVAQPVLEGFIHRSHAAGRRLVLIITGKGKAGGPDAPLPVRPGALRHAVPIWLHRPPLAHLVQQVTPAHYRHGGEGAYYVYLRK